MTEPGKAATFGFFLTDGCDIAPVATAIECLGTANLLLGREGGFRWSVLSETGADVASRSGLRLAADGGLGSLEPAGGLFLNLGPNLSDTLSQALSQRLHSAKYAYSRVGALSIGGVEFLALKRVVAGRRIAVHWNRQAPLREKFPELRFGDEGFSIDRGLYTAAGGTSSAEDLFLAILAEEKGAEFAAHVADMRYVDTTRACGASVRRSVSARLGRGNEAIARIARLMEQHVEETLSLRDLAGMAGVSPRHAERLFRKFLGMTPLQYYLGVRLEHARRLLVYSDLALGEVALASGFMGSSGFNKKYLGYFGIRPSQERGLPTPGCRPRWSDEAPEAPEPRLACR